MTDDITLDIVVENHGSVVLLRPVSDHGREWLDANVQAEARWAGAVVCEPRYVADIVVGAANDGLEIGEG